MKFLQFAAMDLGKAGEVAKASDKVWASPPPGIKSVADYVCLGIAYPGQAANTAVSVGVIEADSAEALTATSYQMGLAGATVWNVPVLEIPVAGVSEVEKKLRG
jgi:hypothetical protein